MKHLPVIAIAMLIGCATAPITMHVTRPPQVNTAAYRTAIVQPMPGEQGPRLSASIRDRLARHGRFVVAAPGTTPDPAGTLFIEGTPHVGPSKESNSDWADGCGAGQPGCRRFVRRVEVSVGAHIVLTGLWAHDFECRSEVLSEAVDLRPAPPDEQPAIDACLDDIADELAAAMEPRNEVVRARFMRLADVPATREALVAAEAGQWETAIAQFKTAVDQTVPMAQPIQAGALWNLGLAYEYAGQLDRAAPCFERAKARDATDAAKYDAEIASVTSPRDGAAASMSP